MSRLLVHKFLHRERLTGHRLLSQSGTPSKSFLTTSRLEKNGQRMTRSGESPLSSAISRETSHDGRHISQLYFRPSHSSRRIQERKKVKQNCYSGTGR